MVDQKVANSAYKTAKSLNASDKVLLALFEAGLVESNMENVSYGDRDSIGFLQQRASWGSVQERMHVPTATGKFVARAKPIESRYNTAGRLAQAVQVSAFPLRYDARRLEAEALISKTAKIVNSDLGATFPGVPTPIPRALIPQKYRALVDPSTWKRVGLVLIGVLLVLLGVAWSSVTPERIRLAKDLASALPIGRLAKGAKVVT